MTTTRTVDQRVADWKRAYDALAAELEEPVLRALINLAGTDATPVSNRLGIEAAQIIFANERAAMIASAMITQSGVSRPILEDV